MTPTSRQIEAWAATRAAQAELPALVRRLLRTTTPTLERLDFPAGDAVHLPGFDGLTKAVDATPWCPAGEAVWEMGCDASPGAKANGDWAKRLEEPEEFRAEQAFVFVTPRLWRGKRTWVKARDAEGAWREVRAYDATDLEAWLEASLAARLWFAERLGAPADLGTPGGRWLETWLSVTDGRLSPELLLLGRETEAARLVDALRDPSARALSVVGDDRGEAIAFLVAALQDAEAADLLDRLIVTATPRRVPPIEAGVRPIVVADLESDEGRPPNLAEVSVVRAYPRGRLNERADVELPHLPVARLEEALEVLGLPRAEAERRVSESGASLTVIRRRLAIDPAVRDPVWAREEEAAAALPMILAGSWRQSSPDDVETLALLADRPWEALETDLARIQALPEAPVLRFGETWVAVSQIDALFALGPRITRKQVEDFFRVLELVLEERDPALDLPPDERWMANVFGKGRPFSETLVQGLGDTLCLLAIQGEAICGRRLGIDLQTRADHFVRGILTDLNREQWLSRRTLLRTLAEASPVAFLDALEAELARPEAAVEAIMGSVGGGISGECLRVDLLWALETLARDPAHVRRAAEILQDLDRRFETDDNFANKPFASLVSLFRAWLPMAPLDVEGRIGLLRHLFERDRESGFGLCLAIVPERGTGFASEIAKPRWRPYVVERGPVTHGERWRMEDAAREQLLEAAPFRPAELADLIERLDAFSPDQQVRITAAAEAWIASDPDDADLARVQDVARTTRRTVRLDLRNRDKLPAEVVDHLDHVDATVSKLFEVLRPRDAAARHAWLFRPGWTAWPDVDGDDVEDYRRGAERFREARRAAVTEVGDVGGVGAVFDFALSMEDPGGVGETYVALEPAAEDLTGLILRAARVGSRAATGLLRGVLWSLTPESLQRTATAVVGRPDVDLNALRRVAAALPGRPEGWRAASALGREGEEVYWASVLLDGFRLEAEDAEYAAARLLAAERPRSAFAAFGMRSRALASRTWAALLSAISEGLEPDGPLPKSYELDEVFARLDADDGFEDAEIAPLEFPFARALRNKGRRGLALHRLMRDDPGQYVEFVTFAFRADDGSPSPGVTEVMAVIAYDLLRSWNALPGLDAEGRIEPDAFRSWVADARRLAADAGRGEVADVKLGEALGRIAEEPGGLWPPGVVRDLLDRPDAAALRRGFRTGVYNNRGVVTKAAYEGGAQERALAERFRALAEELAADQPRLAQTMLEIAEGYRREAEAADQQAALRERWER